MHSYKKGKKYYNAFTKFWTVSLHLQKMGPQFDIINKLEYTLKTCISYIYKIHNCCTHAPVWQRLNGVSSLLVRSIASPVENIVDGLMAAVVPVNLSCHWKL